MEIVGYAFKNTISSQVLRKLNLEVKHYINSDYKELDEYTQKLLFPKPKYILGMGMYSRRDKDKLRIETNYSDGKLKRPINYFLKPLSFSKLANGIGNSYCNFISKKIMENINAKRLNTKYTFIHIPKSFNIDHAAKEIEEMLSKSVA